MLEQAVDEVVESFEAIEALSPLLALPFTLFLLAIVYASYVSARDYAESADRVDVDPGSLLSEQDRASDIQPADDD